MDTVDVGDELLNIHYILPLQVLLVCMRNMDCFDKLILKGGGVFGARTKSKLTLFLADLSPPDRSAVLRDIGAKFACLCPKIERTPRISAIIGRKPHRAVSLGDFVPFSRAQLWTTQQCYYKANNLSAWGTVPFQISSNRYVSQYYLSSIYSAFGGGAGTGTGVGGRRRRRRICLLEVASGHGRLAYLCAKAILDIKRSAAANSAESSATARGLSADTSRDAFLRDNEFLVVGTDMHAGTFKELLGYPWVRWVVIRLLKKLSSLKLAGCFAVL
jgi:hypothetical protein